MTASDDKTRSPPLSLDRRSLARALSRLAPIIPRHCVRPLLLGVRLEAREGVLRITATDLEMSATLHVACEGDLAPCLVPFADLAARVKASADPACVLSLHPARKQLHLNGGGCAHAMQLWDLDEYPPPVGPPDGAELTFDARELAMALSAALRGIGPMNTRYAIHGILLESEDTVVRLAATDGRRLVIVEPARKSGGFTGQVILPARMAKQVCRLIGSRGAVSAGVFIQPQTGSQGDKLPARLSVVGEDWVLSGTEDEGAFPDYRAVIPPGGARFIADRAALHAAVEQVRLASTSVPQAVRMKLGRRSIRLAAGGAATGESSSSVGCSFEGSVKPPFTIAFDPALLEDVFESIPDARIVLEVTPPPAGTAVPGPAVFRGAAGSAIRWVVMPLQPDANAPGGRRRSTATAGAPEPAAV